MNINSTLVKDDLHEIKMRISRLANFDPTCKVEYGYQVLDYLVMDALAINPALVPVTLSEIKTNIKEKLLNSEDARIRKLAEELPNNDK